MFENFETVRILPDIESGLGEYIKFAQADFSYFIHNQKRGNFV